MNFLRQFVSILIVAFFYQAAFGQNINSELINELKVIKESDQSLRRLIFFNPNQQKIDSIANVQNLKSFEVKPFLITQMLKNDSLNLQKIERIIRAYGYPGTDLVGERYNDTAWFVIQHAGLKVQKRYLPVLKQAADSKQLSFVSYAMTLDRVRMGEGKTQIYGSQAQEVILKGSSEKRLIIWPVENPQTVNHLRKKVGFDSSIRKYAKGMGIRYKVYTLDQIQH